MSGGVDARLVDVEIGQARFILEPFDPQIALPAYAFHHLGISRDHGATKDR